MKKIIPFLHFVFMLNSVSAQDQYFSMQSHANYELNPALVGGQACFSFSGNYQRLTPDYASRYRFSVAGAVLDNFGVGGTFGRSVSTYGFSGDTDTKLYAAHRLRLSRTNLLITGIGFSMRWMNSSVANPAFGFLNQGSAENSAQTFRMFYPDLSAGALFAHSRNYYGISFDHLLNPKSVRTQTGSRLPVTVTLMGSHDLVISRAVTIRTSLMFRSTIKQENQNLYWNSGYYLYQPAVDFYIRKLQIGAGISGSSLPGLGYQARLGIKDVKGRRSELFNLVSSYTWYPTKNFGVFETGLRFTINCNRTSRFGYFAGRNYFVSLSCPITRGSSRFYSTGYHNLFGKSSPAKVVESKGTVAVRTKVIAKGEIQSGTLTAGEVNDFKKWNMWEDLSKDELKSCSEKWKILPLKRYVVQVKDHNANPVVNASVQLKNEEGKIVWTARTDNTGKAELWLHLYDSLSRANHLSALVTYKNQEYIVPELIPFHQGINFVNTNDYCDFSDQVDIAMVVDATGSMGDEIAYLKVELENVINRVKDSLRFIDLQMGSVFYRDKGEKYLTKYQQFSHNINSVVSYINDQSAEAGGDYPEAVDDALKIALNTLKWRKESGCKILFLILDAPPHGDKEKIAKIHEYIQLAAAKGIRIVPLAASGTDKSTEYLMRSIALATNGTYAFLTNHSKVGEAHIEPTTDSYEVEKLNELLIRIILGFSEMPECKDPYASTLLPAQDTVSVSQHLFFDGMPPGEDSVVRSAYVADYLNIRIYPNPTSGLISIETSQGIECVYLTDQNGKFLSRIPLNYETKTFWDLSNFSNGVYYLKAVFSNHWLSAKIILSEQ